MIITSEYIVLFFIAIALTLTAWALDAPIFQRFRLRSLKNFLVFLLVVVIIWLCALNFAGTLTALVAATGIICIIDWLFFHRYRVRHHRKLPLIVENARSFFWALLLVWVIRSFVVQPYRVPTGSLQPTIQPGDFLVVNQFVYGLRFPVTNKILFPVGNPKRGDLVLFYFPINPAVVFVKRLIGLPGDHIEYRNKVLYINGEEMKQTDLGTAIDDEPAVGGNPEEHLPVKVKLENLAGIEHEIYVMLEDRNPGNFDIVVPAGHYFMMGDNRDNSEDSRGWGFVPASHLIGKAFAIWLSWDSINNRVRWDRIGKTLQ